MTIETRIVSAAIRNTKSGLIICSPRHYRAISRNRMAARNGRSREDLRPQLLSNYGHAYPQGNHREGQGVSDIFAWVLVVVIFGYHGGPITMEKYPSAEQCELAKIGVMRAFEDQEDNTGVWASKATCISIPLPVKEKK
jgi:hypothetical protein